MVTIGVSKEHANEVWGQGIVFTPVCQSFSSQGVSAPLHAVIHPARQTPLGRHPLGRHPPGGHPLDRQPSGRHLP